MQNWPQFATSYELDPSLGYLIHPHTNITSFNFQLIIKETEYFRQGLSSEAIIHRIDNFPDIGLSEEKTVKDMIILHDLATLIVCVYNTRKRSLGVYDSEIVIPKNLAQPLYVSSTVLGIKLGMTANIAFMWTPLTSAYEEDSEQFGFNDFKMRCCITDNEYQQFLFFGSSIIAAFYLAKVNKMIYEVNTLIEFDPTETDQIKLRLRKCVAYWKKIIKANHRLLAQFDSKYFYYTIRPNIRGFTGIRLQQANKGKDVIASTTGGTGGHDPSFQIFERGFGLVFQGDFKDQQRSLQSGMAKDHKRLLQHYEENSKVRSFCNENENLKTEYNSVLREYIEFLMIHGQFISNFIVQNMRTEEATSIQKPAVGYGTAGLGLKSIINRYKEIQKQLL